MSRLRGARGFTLLEMLTTVAALTIVLGLMVSLARYVRHELAVEASKSLLRQLDVMLQQYMEHNAGRPPHLVPFLASDRFALPDEDALLRMAEDHNRSLVSFLRHEHLLREDALGGLPQSSFTDAMIRDAWGSPIILMPSQRPGIGMAPQDKPFFFSAGPDRKYLTTEDNLYSYEDAGEGRDGGTGRDGGRGR